MSLKRCPGSLSFVQPTPTNVPCPECGRDVEIWSDEATGQCPGCGKLVIRTDTQSCVDWCRYAKECLGEDGYEQYGQMKAAIRRTTLIQAVTETLGDGSPALVLALGVLRYAELLCSGEKTANPTVVIAAALLLPWVRSEASAGPSDATGLDAAKALLQRLNYPGEPAEQVCALLAGLAAAPVSRSPGATGETAIILDAEVLARLEMSCQAEPMPPLRVVIEHCRTDQAKAVAVELHRRLTAGTDRLPQADQPKPPEKEATDGKGR